MKLHKKLIIFYKKTKELETARLKLKELKKTTAKLNKEAQITLSEIQDAIERHIEMKSFSDALDKLPSDLLGIQRKILTILKDIGFPAKKNILINDSHYGSIGFWYEGTYLLF